jgi:extracellular elastinolytic metalloproteinase
LTLFTPSRACRLRTPAAVSLAAALLVLPAAGAGGAEQRAQRPNTESQERTERAFFDVRTPAAQAPEASGAGQAQLHDSLGVQGIVDFDPLTGTPRVVAKLDGFLSGPSAADAKDVALGYVRAHSDVFKLDADDLARLRLVRDYTDIGGTRHLVWAQTFAGIPAFDNDLRASVIRDGRLLNVLGSPVPDLAVPTVSPRVNAAQALGTALTDAGAAAAAPRVVARGSNAARTTRFTGGHRAGLVLFNTGSGVRLAWRVLAFADADEVYDTVVDAADGEVLRRANTVAHASGLAWEYFPGAPNGGTQSTRDFTPWLSESTRLVGPNAHVFADLDDSDTVNTGEESTPVGGNWNHVFDPFTPDEAPQSFCEVDAPCSWNSYGPAGSWQTNRRQNGTQVFYFVNRFHDWLEAAPIGFTAAAGNFEDDDAVVADVLNGASLGGGFLGANMPDENHLNNAFMLTLPDGEPPRMSMFLYTSFDPQSDMTQDVNSGDDARVVYHEYAHGLSNRLITFSNGQGALNAFQSVAMGEGWSDWYGMDFVVQQGFEVDGGADGDVVSAYQGDRTEPIDCPVASNAVACPGAGAAGAGGYTFGDMGKILGTPEVHADGEIWAQTLWDLRRALGGALARELVTRAMELSPVNPSFLDMRNAILEADMAKGGANADAIWQVFAARGMGFFASVDGAHDTTPTENFDVPPTDTGTLTGVISDRRTGTGLGGALVWLGGHTTSLRDTTNSAGLFVMDDVPAGTYPQLFVSKRGYDLEALTGVTVASGQSNPVTVKLRRDWASIPGGARLAAFTGPNNAGVCGFGPAAAFDGSLANGWASNLPAPSITVKLPTWIDMTAFGVDPGETCGDPDEASLRGYKVETSKTGAPGSYALLKRSSFTLSQGGKINVFDSSNRLGARYVRLTMLSNWGHEAFIDLSEITVYGAPTAKCFGLPATRRGSSAANVLEGTIGNDVIVGLGGNDRIQGRGGRDLVCGGDGNDTLVGGLGRDGLSGENGNDTLYARDRIRELGLYGGPGTDRARKDAADRTVGVERLF